MTTGSRSWNVNIDPSSAPSWLVPLLLAATLAAELLDRPEPPTPGLGPTECQAICYETGVKSYSPTSCECQPRSP